MTEQIKVEDVRNIVEDMMDKVLKEQRAGTQLILEKTSQDTSKIIDTVLFESKKVREEIGYQTVILKTLEDNIDKITFDENMGVSSNVEISAGAEILGTGIRFVLTLDTGKKSYKELLETIKSYPGIPAKIKERAIAKLKNLGLQPNSA